MRKGAWLGSVWVALAGCSGGYPLEPTLCDDWCHATHGMQCGYEPAGCVSQCEESRSRSPYDCDAEILEVTACYQAHPEENATVCSFDNYQGACGSVRYALNDCIGGAPRGYSNCYELCIYLANSSCPQLPDLDGCARECAASGRGLAACDTERRAAQGCAAKHEVSCFNTPATGFTPSLLPCQSELEVLRSCGAAL